MTTQNLRPVVGSGLSEWVDSLLDLFWEVDDVVRNPQDGQEGGAARRELPDRVLRSYEAAEKVRQTL